MKWTLVRKQGESVWLRLDGLSDARKTLKHDLDQALFRFKTLKKLLERSEEFGHEHELLAQLNESIELFHMFVGGFHTETTPYEELP